MSLLIGNSTTKNTQFPVPGSLLPIRIVMLTARLTPKTITYALTFHLALLLVLWLGHRFGGVRELGLAHSAAMTVFSCLAFSVAFVLNLDVAAEYRNTRWLRVAWLALAANAAISAVRMVVESNLLNLFWSGYKGSPLAGLLQHLAIVPGNCFLLVGLLAMGYAYHEVGLGFTVKRGDCALISAILGLMLALLVFREGLTEARSPYVFSRYLQQTGLIVLSLTAALSVVLYRMAVQMGGGKLALALQWLTVYVLVRDVLVLVGALQRLAILNTTNTETKGNLFLLGYLLTLGWQSVGWLAALAAAHRAELTMNAARELAQRRAARAALASA